MKWGENIITGKDFFNKFVLRNLDKKIIFKDVRDVNLIKYLKEFSYIKVIYVDCRTMERY